MFASLAISNYRTLADFSVNKLGHINLIVGKNNSGKSSILEAIRIYAGNANQPLMEKIAVEHNENYRPRHADPVDSRSQITEIPFKNFFTGRNFPEKDAVSISIGDPTDKNSFLHIKHTYLADREVQDLDDEGQSIIRIARKIISKKDASNFDGYLEQILSIYRKDHIFPNIVLDSDRQSLRLPGARIINTVPCSTIPTQFLSMDDMASEWDKIVFTDHDAIIKQALKIIAPTFQDLTFVLNENSGAGQSTRIAKIKLSDVQTPVSIKSLGDGMQRILQIALKLVSARGGFLLIDEFENGLHYSVQESVWTLLFEMAAQLDIQVFATTHSWDCIESFAKVAHARQDTEGVLFRVGRSVRTSDRGRVIATVFDEDALYNITQSDVEVR